MRKILYIKVIVLILFALFLINVFIHKNNINKIYNSLVYIECIDESTITSGMGFVYKADDNKNYIVTNYHVIQGYFDIYVYNIKKEKVRANLVNYDENNDIALLVIDDKLGLNEVSIGNISNIKKGSKIFVVEPLLKSNNKTIYEGKVLNFKKSLNIGIDFSAIEILAKTEPGNSGGPLLDKDGKVIGMMFLKDSSKSNIGFAIPINFVIDTVKKLENRPNLGAVMTNTTNIDLIKRYDIELVDVSGVILLEMDYKGLLYQYGLEKGDIIVSVNMIDITNISEFRGELYKYKKGDIIQLMYYRDNKYYNIRIEL
jgi:serine protease Do